MNPSHHHQPRAKGSCPAGAQPQHGDPSALDAGVRDFGSDILGPSPFLQMCRDEAMQHARTRKKADHADKREGMLAEEVGVAFTQLLDEAVQVVSQAPDHAAAVAEQLRSESLFFHVDAAFALFEYQEEQSNRRRYPAVQALRILLDPDYPGNEEVMKISTSGDRSADKLLRAVAGAAPEVRREFIRKFCGHCGYWSSPERREKVAKKLLGIAEAQELTAEMLRFVDAPASDQDEETLTEMGLAEARQDLVRDEVLLLCLAVHRVSKQKPLSFKNLMGLYNRDDARVRDESLDLLLQHHPRSLCARIEARLAEGPRQYMQAAALIRDVAAQGTARAYSFLQSLTRGASPFGAYTAIRELLSREEFREKAFNYLEGVVRAQQQHKFPSTEFTALCALARTCQEARSLVRALLIHRDAWSAEDFAMLTQIEPKLFPDIDAAGRIGSEATCTEWSFFRLVRDGITVSMLLQWYDGEDRVNRESVDTLLRAAFADSPGPMRAAIREILAADGAEAVVLRRVVGVGGSYPPGHDGLDGGAEEGTQDDNV